jgi:nicotinate-nucleotide adenylyltransferase
MRDQPTRIGILGGTFDPMHRGHSDMATAAESTLGLTSVLVIPSHVPPHRPRTVASAFHRFAMAAMVAADHPHWQVSDLELRSAGPSYTAVTLGKLHDRGYGPADLFFIIGADAFADVTMWRDYPRILASTHFAVVSRPGHPASALPDRLPALAPRMVTPPLVESRPDQGVRIILIEASTANVSSTIIRERRAAGQSIEGLVLPSVQKHIEQHELYTSPSPGRRRNDPAPPTAAGRLHGKG